MINKLVLNSNMHLAGNSKLNSVLPILNAPAFDNNQLPQNQYLFHCTNVYSVNSLPNECLYLIFQYLEIADLFNAQRVCRRWKVLIQKSPRLWKTALVPDHLEEAVDYLYRLIPNSKHVQSLVINRKKPATSPKQRTLRGGKGVFEKKYMQFLKTVLQQSNKTLKEFELHEQYAWIDSFVIDEQVFEWLSKYNSNIERLTIFRKDGVGYIGDENMSLLTSFCPRVTEFNDFMEEGLSASALPSLSNWKNLHHLSLNTINFGISEFFTLVKPEQLQHLESLSLTCFSENLHDNWELVVAQLNQFPQLAHVAFDFESAWEVQAILEPGDVRYFLQETKLKSVYLKLFQHSFSAAADENSAENNTTLTETDLAQSQLTPEQSRRTAFKEKVINLTQVQTFPNNFFTKTLEMALTAQAFKSINFRMDCIYS